MAKNDKSVKRGVYLYIDGKSIKNDVTSIDSEIRKLQRDIKNMTIGSAEYNRTMQKIQHLKGILKDHRKSIRGVSDETRRATASVDGLRNGFSKIGGIITAAIGFLTGFTFALSKVREEYNKLDTAQGSLQSLTGLDDDSIDWLTLQASKLATTMTKDGLRVRASADEILNAFMLIGSAKPELLGNKEALAAVTEEAMRLQAAAGDITLKEAADALTLSLNQYGDAADQAARYTNVLAAGSKAGSANIASQAAAIRNCGTAAASANIPIEQTVALIETLAYRGIVDEVAGTGLKKFFLTLQTGAEETNPAIQGLDKALENLKAKNLDAAAIKAMFGEEGYNTASVILANTEMVKSFTEQVTGTHVALEQSARNSRTAAAALDQAKNRIALAAAELGERLNPAFTETTNLAARFIGSLPALVDWLDEWKGVLITTLVPVAAYVGYLKFLILYHTALANLTKAAVTLKILYAAAMANLNGNLSGCNKLLTEFARQMVRNKTLTAVLTAATYLFAAAKLALTGRLKQARIAMAAFNAMMTKNVYVAVATAVVALGAAVYKFATRTSEAKKAAKDFMGQLMTERKELNKLFDAVNRTADGTERRKQLIEEINSKYGSYLTHLLDEQSTLEDIKKAYQDINTAMQANIAQKVLDEKSEEISRGMLDDKVESMNRIRTILSDLLPDSQVNYVTQRIEEVTGQLAATGRTADTIARSIDLGLKKSLLKGAEVPYNLKRQMENYADTVIKEAKRIRAVREELSPFLPKQKKQESGSTNELDEVVITAPRKTTGSPSPTESGEAAAQERYLARIAAIKKRYLDDSSMTQKQYNREMQQAEMELLQEKMAIAGIEPKARQEIANKLLDLQINLRNELMKDNEEASAGAANRMEKEYQLQVEAATLGHYERLTSEEDYLAELARLEEEYYQKVLADTTISEEEKNKIREQMRKRDLKNAEKSYKKELAAQEAKLEQQKQLTDMYTSIFLQGGQQLGEAFAQVLTSQQGGMRSLWKSLLMTAVDAIQQYIRLTYIKVLADSITGLKFVKALPALAKMAAIEASFAAVKGIVSNFYDGGFTPGGAWNQPQGIVHSGEFVANRFAVANPNLRPIFDAIDVAQRSGNVSSLTAEDVMAVSRRPASASPVRPASGSAVPSGTGIDPAILVVMSETMKVLKDIKRRFDQDINAKVYVTGKDGINQAMDAYSHLTDNVKRKS